MVHRRPAAAAALPWRRNSRATRGVGWSVVTLVLATMACSTAVAVWMLSFHPPEWLLRGLTINAIVSSGISAPVSFVLCRLLVDLSRSRTQLHQFANVDALTRASSRRLFMELAPRVIARSDVATLVLLDVDDFKAINDRHGHDVGDRVLRAVSDSCRAALRARYLFARYGGEEFAIILPDTSAVAAGAVIERMRAAIAALEVPLNDGGIVRVTASFGITAPGQRQTGALEETLEQALGAADRALYRAKREGKNRILFDPASVGVAMPAPI